MATSTRLSMLGAAAGGRGRPCKSCACAVPLNSLQQRRPRPPLHIKGTLPWQTRRQAPSPAWPAAGPECLGWPRPAACAARWRLQGETRRGRDSGTAHELCPGRQRLPRAHAVPPSLHPPTFLVHHCVKHSLHRVGAVEGGCTGWDRQAARLWCRAGARAEHACCSHRRAAAPSHARAPASMLSGWLLALPSKYWAYGTVSV